MMITRKKRVSVRSLIALLLASALVVPLAGSGLAVADETAGQESGKSGKDDEPEKPGETAPTAGNPSFAPLPPDSRVPAHVQAEKARIRKRNEDISRVRKAMEADPSDANLLLELIDLHLDANEGAEIVTEARNFVVKQPKNARGFVALGRAQFWVGDYDGALLQFGRAAKLDADDALGWSWRARTLSCLGEWKEAAGAARTAAKLAAGEPEPWELLANALENQGLWTEAADALDRVVAARKKAGREDYASFGKAQMFRALAEGPGPSVTLKGEGAVRVPLTGFKNVPAFEIVFNGSEQLYLMIDLSSRDTVLTAGAAEKLGLKEHGGSSRVTFEGTTVPGVITHAIVNTMRIGDVSVNRVPVQINPYLTYPSPKIGGVLGRSTLRQFVLTLDYLNLEAFIAPHGAQAIEGESLFENGALIVGGVARGRRQESFVVDTSVFMDGPVSMLWAQRELGLTLQSPETRPILYKNYLFEFTMPRLEIAGFKWTNYEATAMDMRSLSTKLGTRIAGMLSNTLLKDSRSTFDIANLKMHLEPTARREKRGTGASAGSPGQAGTAGTAASGGNESESTGEPPRSERN